jgi:MoCo/4Fe-4S cofactor protein with predicted Tat translocation signal
MSNPLIQIIDRTGENKSAPLAAPAAPLDLATVREKLSSQTGRSYWRSLEELAGDDEFNRFLEREFPQQAPRDMAPLARRDFLKLMGASLALAGLSGCAFQPQEEIVSQVKDPEDQVPGIPQFYATAMTFGGYGYGLLAESNQGRPTKLEGNPAHPSSLGATNIFGQAEVLSLYDPERANQIRKLGNNASWEDFAGGTSDLVRELRTNGGRGLHILTETVTSPTLANQINNLRRALPGMTWHQYEPVTRDGARLGAQQAFGSPTHVVYRFDRADRVLSLDANFLGEEEPGHLRYARDFVSRRQARAGLNNVNGRNIGVTQANMAGGMNRLYMVESTPTITGAMADNRLPARASQVHNIGLAIAAKLGVAGATAPKLEEGEQKFVDAVAADLSASRGRSLVLAGSHQPAEVHVLAHAINNALGNLNATVTGHAPVEANPINQTRSIEDLARALAADEVRLLLIVGGNPVFNAPADLKFGELLRRVILKQNDPAVVVHLSEHDDETSAVSTWHLPKTHFLESWGDVRGHDGTISIQQPLIQSLYPDCRSPHDVLAIFEAASGAGGGAQISAASGSSGANGTGGARGPLRQGTGATGSTPSGGRTSGTVGAVAGSATAPLGGLDSVVGGADPATAGGNAVIVNPNRSSLEVVQGYWRTQRPARDFDKQWIRWIHDGVIPGTSAAPRTLAFTGTIPGPRALEGKIEVMFRPDPTIWDGRYANNAWLQELPKHLIKTTWDNAAIMSFAMAERLGVTNDDLVNVRANGRQQQLPVVILPGHPDNAVTVHYGYGRTRAGKVGDNTGRDVFELRSTKAMSFAEGEIGAAGGRYQVARTSHHNIIDPRKDVGDGKSAAFVNGVHERPLIQAGTFAQFQANPASLVLEETQKSLPVVGPVQTGMIDFKKEHAETGAHGGPGEGDHSEGGHNDAHAEAGPKKKKGFPSLYPESRDTVLNDDEISYAWGMSIDTTTCIGCNACVMACQAENNVAVTGKDQVLMGRTMHWLRIDTYYHGDVSGPEIYFQPVMCMHCEKAPCEPVCPVVATQHSPEGINEMVYNRCIGTRYCSNNCPYKVRRFNYLQYSDQDTPQIQLLANPDVTVRARGVMEKCTYCMQRVAEARIQSEKEDRLIRDGEIVTACQQACPTNTIIFGDIRNSKSAVSQLKQQPHAFGMLTELNTYPRTTYLAKVSNPNPALVNPINDFLSEEIKPASHTEKPQGDGPHTDSSEIPGTHSGTSHSDTPGSGTH